MTPLEELDELVRQTTLKVFIRQRDAALRELDRFDRADKGSRWLTHPEEGRRLRTIVRYLDAKVEEYEAQS